MTEATTPLQRFRTVRLEEGWAVMDQRHGGPARIGIEFQTSLAEDAAASVASHLNRRSAG